MEVTNQLSKFLTTVTRIESEWPDSNDQVDEIGRAMDTRKHLLLDGAEDIFDRFTDRLS